MKRRNRCERALPLDQFKRGGVGVFTYLGGRHSHRDMACLYSTRL